MVQHQMSHFISEPAGIAKTWLCAWFALPVQSMLSLHKQPIYTYCLASLWYWWLRKIHMFHSFQTEMLVISRKFLWNIGQWFHYNSITTQKWLFKHGISQEFLYLGLYLCRPSPRLAKEFLREPKRSRGSRKKFLWQPRAWSAKTFS